MRDRICKAFKAHVTILLLNYLTFEADMFDMLSHILEVDSYSWAIQVRDLFGSYHCILGFVFYLLDVNC